MASQKLALITGFTIVVFWLSAQTTYNSVQDGDWDNPNTWALANGDPTGADGKIESGDIVNVLHDVSYNLPDSLVVLNGELNVTGKLTSSNQQNIHVDSTGIITCIGGEIILPIFDGSTNLTGNLSVSDGTITIENSIVEVAEGWIANNGAIRTVDNSCVLIGGSYVNDGATDILNNACIEFGLQGSGNLENLDANSSIDCSFCTILDKGAGNLNNNGNFLGGSLAIIIFSITGDVNNNGSWGASISNYCIGQNIGGSNAADFTDDLPGFENCALAMGVNCVCQVVDPPAPVRFLYFKGEERQKKSYLEWATVQEVNNKGFEIQRSDNGQAFKTIAFVDGVGNSAEENRYEYIDIEPHSGENIYRLKQLDFNGDFEFSSVVPINIHSQIRLEAIPNPAYKQNAELLLFTEYSGAGEIFIYNLKGELLYRELKQFKAGGNRFKIPSSILASGIYLAKANIGFHSISTKFIIIE